jgi:hypothetical protein
MMGKRFQRLASYYEYRRTYRGVFNRRSSTFTIALGGGAVFKHKEAMCTMNAGFESISSHIPALTLLQR